MPLISSHKTAILVFARSSKEETAYKPIYNGEQLFDVLTNQVLETVSKTQLPYFHFCEEQQTGNTFGERFTNAITAVFEKGYEQIITIGNDTPQLTATHLLRAEEQLQTKNFVLGPSIDGGFYLMGLHKSQFDPIRFQTLDWQTSKVSKQLLRLVTSTSTSIFKLPKLFDIDTLEDIKSVVSLVSQVPEKLLLLFTAILFTKQELLDYEFPLYHNFLSNTHHNKGSPLVL